MHSSPFSDDVVEILKSDPAHVACVTRSHVVGERLADFKPIDVQPVLALLLRLLNMNVDGLVAFVGIAGSISNSTPQFAVTLTLSMHTRCSCGAKPNRPGEPLA